MVVLKANNEQYALLNGYTNGVNKLEFVVDGGSNYIVGTEVLSDNAFSEIREQLEQLEQINYIPHDSE